MSTENVKGAWMRLGAHLSQVGHSCNTVALHGTYQAATRAVRPREAISMLLFVHTSILPNRGVL
jgi:hypothetical protein